MIQKITERCGFPTALYILLSLLVSCGSDKEKIPDSDIKLPILIFSSQNYLVNEADNNIIIIVRRSGELSGNSSVEYSIISNATYNAQLGADFQAVSQGTLEYTENETEQSILISMINDDTPEPDKRLLLQLSNPINASLTNSTTAVLTISDDDTPGVLEFSATDYSVLESTTTVTITVNRINGVGGAVSVIYATTDGTAVAIEDYSAATDTLNWASGDASSKSFEIIINNDNVAEPTQSLNISLLQNSLTGSAILGSNMSVLLSIIDDDAETPTRSSLEFFVDDGIQEDYAQQTILPADFGVDDFSLQLWIKPNDSFEIGATRPGLDGDPYNNWSDTNNPPGIGDWWFDGNFLLDGHNNSPNGDGTFSLQIYGSGRLRWLFHDGAADFWAVQGDPTPSEPYLLDGSWHQITLVRRCINSTTADLEMWVNAQLISTTTSDRCTNMRDYWDTWSNFPVGQVGWFWGAEKQAAISNFKWEDYKGLIDEIRFWSSALSSEEISANYSSELLGDEDGLVGWYRLDEGLGNTACNSVVPTECIAIINNPNAWSNAIAPIQ